MFLSTLQHKRRLDFRGYFVTSVVTDAQQIAVSNGNLPRLSKLVPRYYLYQYFVGTQGEYRIIDGTLSYLLTSIRIVAAC